MSLELDHIVLQAGRDIIVDTVSLTLQRGAMNVLLGPTLAGKTTLMRLMAGLDQPTGGRLLLGGIDVVGIPLRNTGTRKPKRTATWHPNASWPMRGRRVRRSTTTS